MPLSKTKNCRGCGSTRHSSQQCPNRAANRAAADTTGSVAADLDWLAARPVATAAAPTAAAVHKAAAAAVKKVVKSAAAVKKAAAAAAAQAERQQQWQLHRTTTIVRNRSQFTANNWAVLPLSSIPSCATCGGTAAWHCVCGERV